MRRRGAHAFAGVVSVHASRGEIHRTPERDVSVLLNVTSEDERDLHPEQAGTDGEQAPQLHVAAHAVNANTRVTKLKSSACIRDVTRSVLRSNNGLTGLVWICPAP